MKMYFKNYKSYNVDLDFNPQLNEGLFDKLSSFFTKATNFFKDTQLLQKSVESTVTQLGEKAKKFDPKMCKINQTIMVTMGNQSGESSINDFTIAFTKIADMSDGSGLFQITGSTSPIMIKALTGTTDNSDLVKNSIMALIPSSGFSYKKPATMKIFKNILPNGKEYSTNMVVTGIVSDIEVEKTLQKIK